MLQLWYDHYNQYIIVIIICNTQYIIVISAMVNTTNVERFTWLSFCGFKPNKVFAGKILQCLTFIILKQHYYMKFVYIYIYIYIYIIFTEKLSFHGTLHNQSVLDLNNATLQY